LFSPDMPPPLRSMTELESWRLLCSTRCQACNKPDGRTEQEQLSSDIWHPGPGMNGVTAVWPFALRACGPCILNRTVKVCSDSPSLLSQIPQPSGLSLSWPLLY
jgi:hypothetical protein